MNTSSGDANKKGVGVAHASRFTEL